MLNYCQTFHSNGILQALPYKVRGKTDIPEKFRNSLMMTNSSLQRILTMHNSNVNIPFKLLIIKMLTMVTHFNTGSFKHSTYFFFLNAHIFIFFISKRSSAVYANFFPSISLVNVLDKLLVLLFQWLLLIHYNSLFISSTADNFQIVASSFRFSW